MAKSPVRLGSEGYIKSLRFTRPTQHLDPVALVGVGLGTASMHDNEVGR